MSEVFFADTDEKVAKVVAACRRAADRGEVVGLDTEFYGVDLRSKSVVAESRLHLLSVGVRRHPAKVHPRGFHVADSAVLLGSMVVAHAGFRAWLASPAEKAVHNLPVDAHTLKNEGIELNGGINTLALARWAWPGRARGPGFTLDSLGRDFCGAGKMEEYTDIFVREVQRAVTRTRKVRGCECGVIPTRGHPRGSTPGHARVTRVEETVTYKVDREEVPLSDVIPGHLLWYRALAYAAQDAVLALYVHELATREISRQEREAPWFCA